MRIAILAVGNEVLSGEIVNTNGAFAAKEAELRGAIISRQLVLPDDVEKIREGLETAYRDAGVVIAIGGLGPTVDDLTRQGAAAYFGVELVLDEKILAGIEGFFSRVGRPMPPNNRQQALGFKTGTFLPNPNGTAPGLLLEKGGRTLFLLPGPPDELRPMVHTFVLPYIDRHMDTPLVTRSFRLYGIGESAAESRIIGLYEKYPQVNLAPYASISCLDYVLTAPKTFTSQLEAFEKDFLQLLGEHVAGVRGVPLAKTVVERLKRHDKTLVAAESCTGGMLASELINIPGVSPVFLEGVVSYSNLSKIRRLGVKEETLAAYGAVSAETACEMAQSLRQQWDCDYALSITGIAGPDGGTAEKPVGLCYIALAQKGRSVIVERFVFPGNREKIRLRAATAALYLLFRQIKTL